MLSKPLTSLFDFALDKSIVLGYSSIGPTLRRGWWPADPEPLALVGQHVVVTGASSGLGRAAAAGIAGLGATVHLVGRDAQRLEVSADLIRHEVPTAELLVEVCDVSDLEDVKSYAAGLRTRIDALHAIVHNAGVMPAHRTETAQGHELALATHVIGPLLLTEELRGLLAADASPRVLMVSSGGMYSAPLDQSIGSDVEYQHGTYEGIRAYARSKRLQVTMSEILADRYAEAGIIVHSMHPGWADTPGVTESMPRFARISSPILRTPEQGADTIVWLTAAHTATQTSGLFWCDRRPRSTYYVPRMVDDPVERQRVWSYVCDAAGITS